MFVVVFRSVLRQDADRSAHDRLDDELRELAKSERGFLGVETLTSRDDAGSVTISQFEDLAAVEEWGRNAHHVLAQLRGRSEFYASYSVQTCQVIRESRFDAGGVEHSR